MSDRLSRTHATMTSVIDANLLLALSLGQANLSRLFEPGTPLTWGLAGIAFVFAVAAPWGWRGWQNAGGAKGADLRESRPEQFATMTRRGYSIIPFSLALLWATLGLVAFNVAAPGGHLSDAGDQWVRLAGGFAAVTFVLCALWGQKEMRRPSPWMPRPDWVRASEGQDPVPRR